MSERADRFVENYTAPVEDFLKFGRSLSALMGCEIRFPANVDEVQSGREGSTVTRRPQFVTSCGLNNSDGFQRVVASGDDLSLNRWQIGELHYRPPVSPEIADQHHVRVFPPPLHDQPLTVS
jgi:hypothetical protein